MTLLTEGKSTLFFQSSNGSFLSVSGKNFVVRDTEKKILQKIPALAVRDICIFGKTDVVADVFSLASQEMIPLHFLNGLGKFVGSMQYDFSKNVFLRHAQIVHHDHFEKRLYIAKVFIRTKIYTQKICFQKIRNTSAFFDDYELQVEKAENIDSLRGIEGNFAKRYFEEWKTKNIIKHPDFNFSGRWKRPPLDPINAMLSFCYTMLHHEIFTQLMICGLDPYFAFVHEQKYGHAALASDFLELYRGIVDHFVITKINLQEFKKDDFEEETGGEWKFSKIGFQKFFPKWTVFLRTPGFWNEKSLVAYIENDIRQFTHFLMNDSDSFTPKKWQR